MNASRRSSARSSSTLTARPGSMGGSIAWRPRSAFGPDLPGRLQTGLYSAPMDAGQILLGAAVVVVAYLIGGIPFGVVVARVSGGPDPRTVGSGRTGGANTMRAIGPKLALVAGLLDAAKGAVVVLIAIALGGGLLIQILAALAAILGHSRSVWIGFKGGRGIAPAFGG